MCQLGQGTVKRTHQTLKVELLKQKGEIEYATPANRLNHTLFVLNF
jgi:hypothetical protein